MWLDPSQAQQQPQHPSSHSGDHIHSDVWAQQQPQPPSSHSGDHIHSVAFCIHGHMIHDNFFHTHDEGALLFVHSDGCIHTHDEGASSYWEVSWEGGWEVLGEAG